MLNLGLGISEYENRAVIPYVWEEPERYDAIFDDDYHVISGRKGSGKSTIVDYKRLTAGDDETIIVLRPADDDEELYDRVREISADATIDYPELRQGLAKLFEFVSFTVAMRALVEGRENELLTGDMATVYSFLSQNDLIGGSAIKQALDKLAEVTGEFKKVNRVFTLLQKLSPPTFQTARDAYLRELKRRELNVTIFIDDIDGYGFEYSPKNKAFLDALIIHAMSTNKMSVTRNAPFRVIVTPPTELFDNANFWNRDKILRKTTFLRWNVPKIEALVNKRISAALGVRKRKRRYDTDVFSIDPKQTWDRIFPANIQNRVGTRERTIEYIVRHTFYTPRNVLNICERALTTLKEADYTLETLRSVPDEEWVNAIQGACEDESNQVSKNVIAIYNTICPGIERLLDEFEGRPNVWDRSAFREFIRDRAGDRVRSLDTGQPMTADHIVETLFSMGFLGYGFENALAPIGARHYDIFFSYLAWTTRAAWDLAIISPVFYDHLRIQPHLQIVVTPHGKLRLTPAQVRNIEHYVSRTNSFR